jgi:hypothetical protein
MLGYQTPPQQPPPTASDRHALHTLAPAQPRLPSCDTVHQTNLILQTSGHYEPTLRMTIYKQAYRQPRSTDRLTLRNKLVGLALGMLSSHPALLCQYPLCYSPHLKTRSLGPSSFLGFGGRASRLRPPAGSLGGYCNADPGRLRHLLTPMRQSHKVVSTYGNTIVATVVTSCRYLHRVAATCSLEDIAMRCDHYAGVRGGQKVWIITSTALQSIRAANATRGRG